MASRRSGGHILTIVWALILSWVALGVFGVLQTYSKQQMFSKLNYGVCFNKTLQAYVIHKSSAHMGRRVHMNGAEVMVFHITAWTSRIVFGAICGIFSYSYSKQNKKIENEVNRISDDLGLLNKNHRGNKKDVK